ncbi:MAG: hypothetical protein JXB05_07175, partial [Myxococcaceae bacterium]|nr:hypothetical protein [Myxococcaceae bacterium]
MTSPAVRLWELPWDRYAAEVPYAYFEIAQRAPGCDGFLAPRSLSENPAGSASSIGRSVVEGGHEHRPD